MSLIWILIAILGLAMPTTSTAPPSAVELAPMSPEASRARADIRRLVAAIEACAASRTDGSYAGPIAGDPDAPDCLSHDAMREIDSALASLDLVDPPAKPKTGQYQVSPVATDGTGYAVTAVVDVAGTVVEYVERHLSDGTIEKTCDVTSGDPDEVVDCDDGSW